MDYKIFPKQRCIHGTAIAGPDIKIRKMRFFWPTKGSKNIGYVRGLIPIANRKAGYQLISLGYRICGSATILDSYIKDLTY